MMRACALGFCGLFAVFAAAQDPTADPGKIPSKGQKGELVPGPFRAFIAVDEHVPANINDNAKAIEVFNGAIKIRNNTARQKYITDETRKYEAQLGAAKKEQAEIAKLMKDYQTSLEEWFAAFTGRNHADAMHDPITEHGLNPVVAIFIREDAKKLTAMSGVARLIADLNKLLTDDSTPTRTANFRGSKLAIVVIFLKVDGMQKSVTVTNPDNSQSTVELDPEYPDDESRDTYAKDIQDLAAAIKAKAVVYGLAPAKSKAATTWAIDPADEVTAVFFNRIRVVDRWKFKAADGPNADEIKAIVSTVESTVLGPKP